MSISKTKTNFIIDILMFLCLATMTGMGLMMKFVLIPGQDRWLIYGKNVELYVLNLERHQWGTVHLIVSLSMLALLAIHIILHWKAVIIQFKSWIANKSFRRIMTVVFVVVCFILVYLPVRIKPEIEEFEGGRGRFYPERNKIEASESVEPEKAMEEAVDKTEGFDNPEVEEEKSVESAQDDPARLESTEVHEEHDTTIDVQGFMTLKEVAENYQVPVDHIKSKLEIPQSVSGNEKLGRLRRTYAFTMSDVRDIIIEYKNKEK